MLLDWNAPVNAKDKFGYYTALHNAAKAGQDEIVQLLLAHKAKNPAYCTSGEVDSPLEQARWELKFDKTDENLQKYVRTVKLLQQDINKQERRKMAWNGLANAGIVAGVSSVFYLGSKEAKK